MDSFLKWMGGKCNLRDEIIRLMPAHKTYVEPFGGAGWVLMGKPPSPVEVFNDVNGNLINLWKTVRDRPDEFKAFLDGHPVAEDLFREYTWLLGYTSARGYPNGIPPRYPTVFKGLVPRNGKISDLPPFHRIIRESVRLGPELEAVYRPRPTPVYLDPISNFEKRLCITSSLGWRSTE